MDKDTVRRILEENVRLTKYVNDLITCRDKLLDEFREAIEDKNDLRVRELSMELDFIHTLLHWYIWAVIKINKTLLRIANGEHYECVFEILSRKKLKSMNESMSIILHTGKQLYHEAPSWVQSLIDEIEKNKTIDKEEYETLLKVFSMLYLYLNAMDMIKKYENGALLLRKFTQEYLSRASPSSGGVEKIPKSSRHKEITDWMKDFEKYVKERLNPDVHRAYS